MKKISKETKIGITAILALAFLIWGINYLKGVNLLKPSNHYYVIYPHTNGLTQSAPININGFQVGTVKNLQYLYDRSGHIMVELSLDENLKLPLGTTAALTPDLVGPPCIELVLGEGVAYHRSGDTLPYICRESVLDVLNNGLMQEIDTLIKRAGNVLAEITSQLQEGGELKQSLASISQTAGHLANASKNLDRMMADEVPSLLLNIDSICSDVAVLSNRLAAIDFQSTIDKIDRSMDNLQSVTSGLNSPDNTIGLLLNDSTLYFNINRTVSTADQLLFDIKAQPKRYVHFSLFGNKKER